MAGLPWTKFQDFYLRLGFLKVLVAVLSPERRSATSDTIVRRLQSPLFDPTTLHPELHDRVAHLFADMYPRRTSSGKEIECPEVAEAILAINGADSALYGITRDTAYKILDWGHDVQLVGRANQITERGVLLRSLWQPERADRFLSGKLNEWRPLLLTLRERLFFLYHLEEIDSLTVELIRDLGAVAEGRILENRDAAKLTSGALLRVLVEAEPQLQSRDILAFRTAQELALTIAAELDEPVPAAWSGVARQLLVARSAKSRSRMTDVKLKNRKTTKNADHQTIPRFEQLIDLGFLTKPDTEVGDSRMALAARRRWKYVATGLCRRWSRARKHYDDSQRTCVKSHDPKPFRWNGFARTAVASFHALEVDSITRPTYRIIGERLWAAYSSARRSVGLSPVDSIALVAMIDSVADGVCIEMADIHDLLLKIQERAVLADCVHFASGRALDKMFIQLKPSFPDRFAEVADQLEVGEVNG
jgi:hypothetical protein